LAICSSLTFLPLGIGLAVSNFLLTKKCNVVVVARSADSLQQIQQQHPDRVKVIAKDLTDLSLGKDVVNLAINTWGRLDGLVINHGALTPVKTVANASVEEWRESFDVNFFSAISLVTHDSKVQKEYN
jgi:NADP-dependent 3-hydroxy acid dehydrogenase YdfG